MPPAHTFASIERGVTMFENTHSKFLSSSGSLAAVARQGLGLRLGLGRSLGPGLGLCLAVSLLAVGLDQLERRLLGHDGLESLVLAILAGAAIRTAWTPGPRWRAGTDFCAKLLLEVAVVLLGASLSASALVAAGPALLAGVGAVVILAIGLGYGLARLLGLPHRLATLVACGNAICGNSAIAAVAPTIHAEEDEVATAIAFTAVLGVGVVLGLPLISAALHMSGLQSGALAGLTVYAVPQVLAAAAPMGPLAVRFGTLVKLARVLMLGPVCLVLSLLAGRPQGPTGVAAPRPRFGQLVPWFILGFLALAAARSAGLIPTVALAPMAQVARWLTVVAMAALGLGTDLRAVTRSGGRVALAASLSLLTLGLISLALIGLLRLG